MARVEMAPGWKQKVDHAVEGFMNDLAGDVLADMRQHCPIDTGRLLADLDKEVSGGYARIGARSVPYAIYVEEGVGPHIIMPNSKNALFWPGASHPVQRVLHPGTPATHFMRNALYKQRRGI